MERIFITPNVANPYDQRMVSQFASAFTALGHFAVASNKPLSSLDLLEECKKLSITVVIQINRTRDPAIPLPKGTRHISWYQDEENDSCINFQERFLPGDILYTIIKKELLGLTDYPLPCFSGILYTGVADYVFNYPPQLQDINMSLLGALPGQKPHNFSSYKDFICAIDRNLASLPLVNSFYFFWLLRKIMLGNRIHGYIPKSVVQSFSREVKKLYQPLRGNLDINQIVDALREKAAPFMQYVRARKNNPRKDGKFSSALKSKCADYRSQSSWKSKMLRLLANDITYADDNIESVINGFIMYYAVHFPRVIDRELLVRMAREVTPSVEWWGNNLDQYDFTRPYAKGVITDLDSLLRMYRRSKINLANNPYGLGIHSRNLECMGAGGFIFWQYSTRDKEEGGMRTSFEPGVHYGEYTPENFHDEAKRWLSDDKKRMEIGEAARKVVKEKHRWINRARQVLDDLER